MFFRNRRAHTFCSVPQCREKKQKIQDIRKNVKDAIVVSFVCIASRMCSVSLFLHPIPFYWLLLYKLTVFFLVFILLYFAFSSPQNFCFTDYSVCDEHFNTPSPASQPRGPIQNRIHQKHSTSLWLWLFTGKTFIKVCVHVCDRAGTVLFGLS